MIVGGYASVGATNSTCPSNVLTYLRSLIVYTRVSTHMLISEVVLFVRPLCSPFKVDQGFILGC